jgi:medium-chain acyl-[acyl-carrier-protein] hydrolase
MTSAATAGRLPSVHDADRDDPPWWVVFGARPVATLPFFCFPYAGGHPHVFRSWHLQLPAHVEVRSMQLPGRARLTHRQPFRRMADLTAAIGPAIAQAVRGPFALFGHSLGAIVAFEIARWLRANHGVEPALLAVAGHRAPHLPNPDPPLHVMNDDDLVAAIARLNGATPEALRSPEVVRFMLPLLRADFELAETYQCADDRPLSAPIVAFGGTTDDETADGRLEAWRAQTDGVCSFHWVPGDHFFIRSNERSLLGLLDRELATWLPGGRR